MKVSVYIQENKNGEAGFVSSGELYRITASADGYWNIYKNDTLFFQGIEADNQSYESSILLIEAPPNPNLGYLRKLLIKMDNEARDTYENAMSDGAQITFETTEEVIAEAESVRKRPVILDVAFLALGVVACCAIAFRTSKKEAKNEPK